MTRPIFSFRLGLLAALLCLVGATTASAVPMPATGGTSIYLSSAGALDGLGLTVDLIGAPDNAVLNPTPFLPSPTVTFRITEVDLVTTEIFHDGSGLGLSSGSNFVNLENFVINGGGPSPSISAAVETSLAGFAGIVDVFSLRDCRSLAGFCLGLDGRITVDGLGLFLTPEAVAALEGEFGQGSLGSISTNSVIGVANSTFIPEPSTALLVGGGLLVLAARRRA